MDVTIKSVFFILKRGIIKKKKKNIFLKIIQVFIPFRILNTCNVQVIKPTPVNAIIWRISKAIMFFPLINKCVRKCIYRDNILLCLVKYDWLRYNIVLIRIRVGFTFCRNNRHRLFLKINRDVDLQCEGSISITMLKLIKNRYFNITCVNKLSSVYKYY